MGRKSTPPSPNYAEIAQQQGAANVETARTQGRMNNPNIISPTGTQTVTWAGDQPTITQTMDPVSQYLYDLTQEASGAGLRALNQYGMPAVTEALRGSYSLPGSPQTDFSAAYKPTQGFQYGIGQTPEVQLGLDYSGAPKMPEASEAVRQQVIDSLYGQGARFLDRRYGQAEERLGTGLSNQGIFRGSEAYEGATGDLAQQKMREYQDLVDRSIQAGGAEQSRLFADQLAARQQGVGETTTQGQFRNQAVNQLVNQLLAQMGAGNAAVTGAYNVAGQQAGLAQAGRSQALNELIQSRTLPINVMNALMSSGQVGAPPAMQFNPTAVEAPPIFQAGVAQGQSDLNAYNARQAAIGNWLNAGSRIGSAFIPGGR